MLRNLNFIFKAMEAFNVSYGNVHTVLEIIVIYFMCSRNGSSLGTLVIYNLVLWHFRVLRSVRSNAFILSDTHYPMCSNYEYTIIFFSENQNETQK